MMTKFRIVTEEIYQVVMTTMLSQLFVMTFRWLVGARMICGKLTEKVLQSLLIQTMLDYSQIILRKIFLVKEWKWRMQAFRW